MNPPAAEIADLPLAGSGRWGDRHGGVPLMILALIGVLGYPVPVSVLGLFPVITME